MKPFIRQSYLTLPSFQIRLTVFLVLLLLIGSVVHGFFLYRITARTIEEGFLSAHNRLRSTWDILKPAVVLTNGMSFLVLSLSFGFAIVLISHRLVGPLFKIEKRLRDLAEGRLDLPHLKLRANDEGQMLIDGMNHLQDRWRERFQRMKELERALAAEQSPEAARVRSALADSLHGIELEPPAASPQG